MKQLKVMNSVRFEFEFPPYEYYSYNCGSKVLIGFFYYVQIAYVLHNSYNAKKD
jgi:hypothetical protein